MTDTHGTTASSFQRALFSALALRVGGVAAGLALAAAGGAAEPQLQFELDATDRTRLWRASLPGQLAATCVYCRPATATVGGTAVGSRATGTDDCVLFFAVFPDPGTSRPSSGHRTSKRGAQEHGANPVVYGLDLTDSGETRPVARELGELRPLPEAPTPAGLRPPQLEIVEIDHEPRLLTEWRGRVHLRSVDDWSRFEGPFELDHAPWRSLHWVGSSGAWLAGADVGELHLTSLRPGGDPRRHGLPVHVEPANGDLVLISPTLTVLAEPQPSLLVGPEAQGRQRLRTLRYEPTASPDEEPSIYWSALPSPEWVTAAAYWMLDDRPVLATVTQRSDRVGLFERKKLRLFELATDRTRAGKAPFFATRSSSRLWQQLSATVVEQRGARSLVLVQPEGLSGGKLAIDRYDAEGSVGFSEKARRSLIRVPEGWWYYGEDWTRDGLADLVTLSSGVFRLFAGLDPGVKRPLESEARWSVRLLDGVLDPKERKSRPSEERRRRQARFERGFVIVRSVDPQGAETLEVMAPAPSRGSAPEPILSWQLRG